ncbi:MULTISPECIES: MgtC/SapB family protein [unclassified Nitratiruptor]|uniref:MgtC/SapB family protein n=1 Tax=unclassified Nitratiruptor TaxID=2624044 RepID=UPI001916C6BE|nr:MULTISPECIES: MgtC/SapB family protein [unclassified Nitratiruptor]BCD59451.1 hypothetical protein NitYY0810_C0187 [Nitratiruptor sp. YY08-10]BCD63375.1 hypothetical protein NitYY0814_C0187 [Nitratiruptor sp. YY08-14]
MDYEILKHIFIALAIGIMIGLQRSLTYILKNNQVFMGTRTFALIALGGFLSGWIETKVDGFILLSFFLFALFVALTYYFKVQILKKIGITTQIAAILTFIFGLMVWYRLENYAIFLAVITVVLLEIKPKLQQIERHISPTDINAVVLLLVMTFIILPILPDKMIGPYHLFNPYKTWVMAIIISALSFIGYVAIKTLGQRHGVLITGAAGGLISSTAVSITLSDIFPREHNLIKIYTAGIAISWTFMFIRVFVEALLIDWNVAKLVAVPYLLTAAMGGIYVYYLYKTSPTTKLTFHNEELEKNPLQLSEAIKFGLLFGIIYGAIAFVETKYGNIGVYIVSVISGITDVDAITLSLSEMAKESRLGLIPALTGIVLASYTNTLVKLGIVYWLGGRSLGWSVTKFTILITITLFGGIFLLKAFL